MISQHTQPNSKRRPANPFTSTTGTEHCSLPEPETCGVLPDDPRGPFNIGVAAFKARDYATARAELGPASALPETAAYAYYYLARMARAENEFEEALGYARHAVEAVAGLPLVDEARVPAERGAEEIERLRKQAASDLRQETMSVEAEAEAA